MTDEAFESRLDRIEALVERNSEQISALTGRSDAFQRALNGVIEIVGLTAGQLNQLVDRVDDLTTANEQLRDRVDSLAAASERYDRILDYLIRRDGGGSLE